MHCTYAEVLALPADVYAILVEELAKEARDPDPAGDEPEE